MSLQNLYQTIQNRYRPEDIIKILKDEFYQEFTPYQKGLLTKSLGRYYFSYMSTKFADAADLSKQLNICEILFKIKAPTLQSVDGVTLFVNALKKELQVTGVDFKTDRATKKDREQKGLDKNHAQYNKKFRALRRLVLKFETWKDVKVVKDLAKVAKSRLATKINYGMFEEDQASAFFIAYMVASLNERSQFTVNPQDRAYDKVANMLFNRIGEDTGNWLAIAYVHPVPEVLKHLTEEEKGSLLGTWYSVMVTSAGVLEKSSKENELDLVNLVVRRGNDSSTWNEAAGAFNKSREGWINSLYSLGAEDLLEKFTPPKALRLMAADVVAMHSRFGSGGLEGDTAVWGELPRPWDVISGNQTCTRQMVEDACKKHKIEGKGWISPRKKSVADFKPTNELVHGVAVSSPELASQLKKLGYYSGKVKA